MLERQIRLFNSLRKIVSRIEDKLAETNHKIEEMKWEMINKDEMICEQKGLVRECREEIIHFQKKIKEGEKREAELRKEIRNFKVHKLIPKQWNKISNLNWNISNAIKKIFSGKEKISKEKESHFAQRVDDCKNQRPPMTKLREAVAREFDQGNKEIVLKKATTHLKTALTRREVCEGEIEMIRNMNLLNNPYKISPLYRTKRQVGFSRGDDLRFKKIRENMSRLREVGILNERINVLKILVSSLEDKLDKANRKIEEMKWEMINKDEVICELEGIRRREIRHFQKKIKEGEKREAELRKEIRNLKIDKLIPKHWNKVPNRNWNIFNAIKKIFSRKENISKGKESHFEQRLDDCKNHRLEIAGLREAIAREFAQRDLQLESLRRRVSQDRCQKEECNTRVNTERTQIEKKNKKLKKERDQLRKTVQNLRNEMDKMRRGKEIQKTKTKDIQQQEKRRKRDRMVIEKIRDLLERRKNEQEPLSEKHEDGETEYGSHNSSGETRDELTKDLRNPIFAYYNKGPQQKYTKAKLPENEKLVPRSETTRPEMALSGRVSCKREGENRNGKTLYYNSLGLDTPYDEIKRLWQLDDSKRFCITRFALAKITIEDLKKEIVELDQKNDNHDNLVKELQLEISVRNRLLTKNKINLMETQHKVFEVKRKLRNEKEMVSKLKALDQKCRKEIRHLQKKIKLGEKRESELEKQIKNLKVNKLISKHCDKLPNIKESKSNALKGTFFRKENFSKERESHFEQRVDDCKNQRPPRTMLRDAVVREFAPRNKEIVLRKATTHLETALTRSEVCEGEIKHCKRFWWLTPPLLYTPMEMFGRRANISKSVQRIIMERRISELFKERFPDMVVLMEANNIIAALKWEISLRQLRRNKKDIQVQELHDEIANLKKLVSQVEDRRAEESRKVEEVEREIINQAEMICEQTRLVRERREEIRLLQKKIKEGEKREAELRKEIRNLKVHKLISKHWNKVSNRNWNIFNAIKKIFSGKEKISKEKESHFEQRLDDCKNHRLEIAGLREAIAREFAQRDLQLESLRRRVSQDRCQKEECNTRVNTERTQIEKKNKKLKKERDQLRKTVQNLRNEMDKMRRGKEIQKTKTKDIQQQEKRRKRDRMVIEKIRDLLERRKNKQEPLSEKHEDGETEYGSHNSSGETRDELTKDLRNPIFAYYNKGPQQKYTKAKLPENEKLVPRSETTRPEMALSGRVSCKREGENRNGKTLYYNSLGLDTPYDEIKPHWQCVQTLKEELDDSKMANRPFLNRLKRKDIKTKFELAKRTIENLKKEIVELDQNKEKRDNLVKELRFEIGVLRNLLSQNKKKLTKKRNKSLQLMLKTKIRMNMRNKQNAKYQKCRKKVEQLLKKHIVGKKRVAELEKQIKNLKVDRLISKHCDKVPNKKENKSIALKRTFFRKENFSKENESHFEQRLDDCKNQSHLMKMRCEAVAREFAQRNKEIVLKKATTHLETASNRREVNLFRSIQRKWMERRIRRLFKISHPNNLDLLQAQKVIAILELQVKLRQRRRSHKDFKVLALYNDRARLRRLMAKNADDRAEENGMLEELEWTIQNLEEVISVLKGLVWERREEIRLLQKKIKEGKKHEAKLKKEIRNLKVHKLISKHWNKVSNLNWNIFNAIKKKFSSKEKISKGKESHFEQRMNDCKNGRLEIEILREDIAREFAQMYLQLESLKRKVSLDFCQKVKNTTRMNTEKTQIEKKLHKENKKLKKERGKLIKTVENLRNKIYKMRREAENKSELKDDVALGRIRNILQKVIKEQNF
ncbi:trichohyalin-like [Palaemon carinicauda]|uniref:trichohyalin-like n=1 Tax=Palaemon carinicauda TaxID=392227 RepID=UPI0035B67AFD